MKKLFIMALLLVGTTIIAQERNKRPQRNQMEQFTPEQQSQLILKKMTLELDLNDSQQKQMSEIISEKMAKKEAFKTEMKAKKEKGEKPSRDDRFAMKMKMLDEQIATKKRVEKILNAKQFEKWTALKEDLKENRQERFRKFRQEAPRGKHQEKRQG